MIQTSERFSSSDPRHVIQEPSHNGLGGSHIARTMDTFHASKQSSHGSLAADNTLGCHPRVATCLLTWGMIQRVQFCPTS